MEQPQAAPAQQPASQPAPVQQSVAPAPTPVTPAPQVDPSVQQAAQQIAQAPVVTQPSFELPQGVTDRTREQFDKLVDNNQKLLEANRILQQEAAKRALSENQLAPLQQVAKPQQPDVTQFIETDPLTGEQYINERKLQDAISQANDRAVRAEQQVKSYIEVQQRREDEKQAREAYTAYPQLDPNNLATYDKELNREVRAYALDSMMYPAEYGGRTLSYKEAADLAYKKLYSNKQVAAPSQQAQQISAEMDQTQQPTQNANNTNQQQTTVPSGAQEQGGMAAEGRPVNVNPQSQDDDLLVLQDRTRRGDMWALAKRLTAVPHTGTPTHGGEDGGE